MARSNEIMKALQCKIKISVLWILFAISASAAMITWLIEPGVIEQIMTKGEFVSEKLTKVKIVFFALWWLIPLSMAILTLIFSHSYNRYINLIFGITFSLLTIYYFISNLLQGWFTVANSLILLFSLAFTVLIAVYALKLPKADQ
jgi:hypothetical protein